MVGSGARFVSSLSSEDENEWEEDESFENELDEEELADDKLEEDES